MAVKMVAIIVAIPVWKCRPWNGSVRLCIWSSYQQPSAGRDYYSLSKVKWSWYVWRQAWKKRQNGMQRLICKRILNWRMSMVSILGLCQKVFGRSNMKNRLWDSLQRLVACASSSSWMWMLACGKPLHLRLQDTWLWDGVNIDFSKYMLPASIDTSRIEVSLNGRKVKGTLKLLNEEKDMRMIQICMYRNSVLFQVGPFTVDDVVRVMVRSSVESYIAVPIWMLIIYQTVVVEREIKSIIVDSVIEMRMHGSVK